MPQIVYGQDQRLVGCTDVAAAVSDTRLILANPLRNTLVTVGVAGSAPNVANAAILVQCESAVLPTAPRVVSSDATAVVALGVDKLYRVTNGAGLDTAGYAVNAFTIDCPEPRWVVTAGGYVYVPFEQGGFAVYTTLGVFVAKYDHVLSAATHAALSLDGTYLYLLDSMSARGVAIGLGAAGAVTIHPGFAATNCKDVVAIVPDSEYVVVACRDRINLFSRVDQTTPLYVGAGRFDFGINDMVRVTDGIWWVASDEYIEQQHDRFAYKNKFAIYQPGRGVVAVAPDAGRVVTSADFVGFRPDTVYVPPVDPDVPVVPTTSRILKEDGALVLDETGASLDLE